MGLTRAPQKPMRKFLDLGTDPNWLRQIARDKKHSEFEFVGVNKELKRQDTRKRFSLRRGDAIKYLQTVPDHSLDVINADFFVNNLEAVSIPEAVEYLKELKRQGEIRILIKVGSYIDGDTIFLIDDCIDLVENHPGETSQMIKTMVSQRILFNLIKRKLKSKGILLLSTYFTEQRTIVKFLKDAGFNVIVREITYSDIINGKYSDWTYTYVKRSQSNPNEAPILIVAQPK